MPRTDRLDPQRDPIAVFREWHREASASGEPSLPDATCLSTVDGDGTPHAVLPGDVSLGDRLSAARERFGSGEVPRPPHWGGYVVTPDRIEFLVFEVSRAHRRVLYERHHGKWTVSELQP